MHCSCLDDSGTLFGQFSEYLRFYWFIKAQSTFGWLRGVFVSFYPSAASAAERFIGFRSRFGYVGLLLQLPDESLSWLMVPWCRPAPLCI